MSKDDKIGFLLARDQLTDQEKSYIEMRVRGIPHRDSIQALEITNSHINKDPRIRKLIKEYKMLLAREMGLTKESQLYELEEIKEFSLEKVFSPMGERYRDLKGALKAIELQNQLLGFDKGGIDHETEDEKDKPTVDLSKLSLDELEEYGRLVSKARIKADDDAIDVTPEKDEF